MLRSAAWVAGSRSPNNSTQSMNVSTNRAVNAIRSLRDGARRLLIEPQAELTRWQRAVRFALDLTRHCAGELRYDKAGQLAAALTYHTLFSLLPVTALMLVALNMFVGPEERDRFKETAVDGIVELLRGGATMETSPGSLTPEEQEFEMVRDRLNLEFQRVLTNLESINFGSIGLVGVLLLVYAATGLLSTIEGSFNQILGGGSGRPWYLRLPLYYTVITLGPVVILAGMWGQREFLDMVQNGGWTDWITGPAVVLTPIVSTWLVLYLLYVLLPTVSVNKGAALVGSFVSALLLVASRELFQVYVSQAVARTLYGALALLPLFLLLIFITWVVVLFGLELAYTLHSMDGRRFKRDQYKRLEGRLFDPALSVPLVERISVVFSGGGLCDAEVLSHQFKLPPLVVHELLRRLVVAGILRRARDGKSSERREGYLLAKPPDRIALVDIMRAVTEGRDLAPGVDRTGPAWRWVADTRRKAVQMVRSDTLQDLLDQEPETPTP